ncbi:MAG TPA: hypothetical protein VIL86_11730 [Tepidisphaeraceae bacterium]|jgi:Tfp pilus assembly protein PilN
MRELEFLPQWYPQIHRRKRMVVLQAWMTLTLAGGLALWMFLVGQNTSAEVQRLRILKNDVGSSQVQVSKLQEMQEQQRQLRQQYQVIDKLGLHVEAARIINKLESSMTPEMALLDLNFEVVEQAAAAAPGVVPDKNAAMERWLKVKLLGLAPTDVDLANFLARLGNVPFFQPISMTYAKDRSDQGHVMREFEITFSVNLNSRG